MSASFATTRWTLVLAAGASPGCNQEKTTSAHRALSELCQTYWSPLHAHARRHGLPNADAEDAVQGFFARLLRLESIASVQREHGRFRSFLLASFNHYLADIRDHAHAQKRDARLLVSLEHSTNTGTHCATPPAADLTPDQAFDRAWALALLDATVSRLRDEYIAENRLPQFEALAPKISVHGHAQPFSDIADKLGITESAARVAAHRLRQRYRKLLREEIAHTLVRPEDTEDELHHLFTALSQS